MACASRRNLRIGTAGFKADDSILESGAVVKFKRYLATRIAAAPCRNPVEALAAEKCQPLLALTGIYEPRVAFTQPRALLLPIFTGSASEFRDLATRRNEPLIERIVNVKRRSNRALSVFRH